MGFRTLEIGQAAELHVKKGQLEITTADGVALVPIEDLTQIPKYTADFALIQAAHQRTDVDIPDDTDTTDDKYFDE